MQWYAMCTTTAAPHELEPNSGQYLPWVGPDRYKYIDAKADADNHNKNAGHTAQVFQRL